MAPRPAMVKAAIMGGAALQFLSIVLILQAAVASKTVNIPLLLVAYMAIMVALGPFMWGMFQGKRFQKEAFGRVLLACVYAPAFVAIASFPLGAEALGLPRFAIGTALGLSITVASVALAIGTGVAAFRIRLEALPNVEGPSSVGQS